MRIDTQIYPTKGDCSKILNVRPKSRGWREKRRRRLVQRQFIHQNPTRAIWGGRGRREKSNDTTGANSYPPYDSARATEAS